MLRQQLGGASYGRAHCPQLPSRHWSAGVEAGAAAAAFGHGKTRVSQRGGRGHCSPPQEQALCWGQVAWAPRGAAPCSGADQDVPRLCRDHAETTTPDSHAGQVPVRGTWEARAVSESPSPLCDTSQKSHSSPSHTPSQAALRTLPGSWFVPGESPPTVKALESPGNSQGPVGEHGGPEAHALLRSRTETCREPGKTRGRPAGAAAVTSVDRTGHHGSGLTHDTGSP